MVNGSPRRGGNWLVTKLSWGAPPFSNLDALCTFISPTAATGLSRSHLLVGKNSPTISSTRVASLPTHHAADDLSIVFIAIITNLSSIIIIVLIISIKIVDTFRLITLRVASHLISSPLIASSPIATPKPAFAHRTLTLVTHFFPCMAQSP